MQSVNPRRTQTTEEEDQKAAKVRRASMGWDEIAQEGVQASGGMLWH